VIAELMRLDDQDQRWSPRGSALAANSRDSRSRRVMPWRHLQRGGPQLLGKVTDLADAEQTGPRPTVGYVSNDGRAARRLNRCRRQNRPERAGWKEAPLRGLMFTARGVRNLGGTARIYRSSPPARILKVRTATGRDDLGASAAEYLNTSEETLVLPTTRNHARSGMVTGGHRAALRA